MNEWNTLELGTSTYEYKVDDHCIRIRPKTDNPDNPGIWADKKLCAWLGDQGSDIIDSHYSEVPIA